jgi:hypothetical protein
MVPMSRGRVHIGKRTGCVWRASRQQGNWSQPCALPLVLTPIPQQEGAGRSPNPTMAECLPVLSCPSSILLHLQATN